MIRYLVFAYDNFYPGGGMNDCVGRTDDGDEANAIFDSKQNEYDYLDLYDCEENRNIRKKG